MVSGAHPLGVRSARAPACLEKSVPIGSLARKVEAWRALGGRSRREPLPFFVDFLKQADLFDPFVPEAPLEYSSPNAPRVTDVLGRLLLSVASGHPDRLNRATPVEGIREGVSSPQYAREELRAEISSMITGDRLQLGHDSSRHAAYVSHWIQALKDDSHEIYRASQDAQVMSDYLLDRTREKLTEREIRPVEQRERVPRNPFRQPEGRPEQQRPFQREAAVPSR